MGKIKVYIQCFSYGFMVSEFFTVVRSHCVHSVCYWSKQTSNGLSNKISGFARHFGDQAQLRFSCCVRKDGLFVAFANGRVQFPVTVSRATVNAAGALVNGGAIVS